MNIARIAAYITAGIVLAMLPASWLFAADPGIVSSENEFVRMVVNPGPEEAGRFSIKTTGGDPSRPASRNQHLIFGGNAPWTTYTTVMLDGEKYVFGGGTHRRAGIDAKIGEQLAAPAQQDGGITCAYKMGDVEVVQEMAFVRGLGTRMLDTVGITYRITNKGTADHQIGLRLMLDTMCGSNDGAPVRAGNSAITTATALSGSDVPDYWQAFDDLAEPTVISQGTLRGGTTTPPDKILFADWGTLADEPWEPAIAPDQGFIRKGEEEADTAVALFWTPAIVEPGKTRTIVTYYGIGDVSLKPGKMALGLTAQAETTFEHERTQAFTIAGYLKNAGGFDARDVTLTLTLPEGLSLVNENAKLQQSFDLLKPDDTVQQSWVVKPNGKQGGKLKLVLEAKSANVETNKIVREIQIIVPKQQLQFSPDKQRVPALTNRRPTIVPIEVNLSPAEAFTGARFTIKYDPKVLQPIGVVRGRACTDEGRLLAGWEDDTSEDGVITISAMRNGAAPITQAEANLATIKFCTVGIGKAALRFEKAVLIDEKGKERPVDVAAGEIEVVNNSAK